MKYFKKMIFFLFITAAVLSVIAGAYLGYLYHMNGRILKYEGKVQIYKTDKDSWEPLSGNYTLKEGDIVKTGPGSNCEFVFGNTANTTVEAGEDTEMALTSKNPVGLELADGELLAALTRPGRVKGFTVKTPNGTCGVRGTGWRVSADKEKNETNVEVFEGRVKFGRTVSMYNNDPYITRSGDTLFVKKEETTAYEYADLPPSEYKAWNEWMDEASQKLSKVHVANYLVHSEPDPYPAWQEGMCYTSWQTSGYTSIESQLSIPKMEKDTNASWINIVSTWYQPDIKSRDIEPIQDKSPSDESLITVIKEARRHGFHIMLSPYVDLISHEGGSTWRGDIAYSTNEEWDEWFTSYENFILHYAQIAQEYNVEILNIGIELSLCTTQRPDKWIEAIRKIREVYNGKLTYTANWNEEYKDIKFWKYLDYAGISAYFPLADKEKPSYGEIKKNWEKWAEEIETWQKTHGKPVLFPEVGYKSCEGSAMEPWQWVSGGEIDLQQQYNCYKAVLETFWDKKWFYGMYWWSWGTKPTIQGRFDKGFTPNDKPAAELVAKWYDKPDPHKYKSIPELIKGKMVASKDR